MRFKQPLNSAINCNVTFYHLKNPQTIKVKLVQLSSAKHPNTSIHSAHEKSLMSVIYTFYSCIYLVQGKSQYNIDYSKNQKVQ